MANRNFRELLEARWAEGKFVCVGLDSELTKIPERAWVYQYEGAPHDRTVPTNKNVAATLIRFNKAIIDATKDIVLAYKPNAAFYEAYGEEGMKALSATISYINAIAPKVPVILDSKRGDIGNTNAGYVQATFEALKADAITVHPYLGAESLKPFLDLKDKGVIVLCRTSNPGAGEFQDLVTDGVPQYQTVARQVAQHWNKNGNCAVVVGATYPAELAQVRQIVGDLPILIPGIGAQGGDLEKTVAAGRDSRGRGIIINSSRGIIFASKGADFAEAARRETIKLNDQIIQCLATPAPVISTSENLGGVSEDEIKQILADAKAVLQGHFVYKSGNHGPAYINKDAVYPHTDKVSRLCLAIAQRFAADHVDVVVGPTIGGVPLSQWTAHHLTQITGREVLALYAEKEGEGFALRRGYDQLAKGRRALVVEDILTKGESARKTVGAVRAVGGEVVGVGALCNRGGVTVAQLADIPKLEALLNVNFIDVPEAECLLCRSGIPINTNVGKGREYLAKRVAASAGIQPA